MGLTDGDPLDDLKDDLTGGNLLGDLTDDLTETRVGDEGLTDNLAGDEGFTDDLTGVEGLTDDLTDDLLMGQVGHRQVDGLALRVRPSRTRIEVTNDSANFLPLAGRQWVGKGHQWVGEGHQWVGKGRGRSEALVVGRSWSLTVVPSLT